MKRKILLTMTLFALAATLGFAKKPAERWSEEKANAWMAKQGWIVGCDYVCATAINQIEMWQAETFDPAMMDKEMGWAEGLGFNTVRVFLSDLVYTADPKGFKARFEEFLGIIEKHHIRAIVTFWTNGGKCKNPKLGKQPESVQGVHNSQWCMVPGTEVVNDPTKWHELEVMVKDIIKTYKNDDRILFWCLYNEPQNTQRGVKKTLPLMKETFRWAREINPSQPLTAPIWEIPSSLTPQMPTVTWVWENSDIISFHCYKEPGYLEKFIKLLLPYNRPLVCTEYMGRPKSTFKECMPILKKYNVGAINFGFTAGKCNFHLQWTSKAGDPEPKVWFHDIFRLDGTPYSQEEVDFIREMTGVSKK